MSDAELVLPAPTGARLPVIGTGKLFPVRRIYCVGRNYGAHVREMGGDPSQNRPIFFQKPSDAALCVAEVPYPPGTSNLHHEIELVIALKGGGADLAPGEAEALVFGFAVGIDLTRRDLQEEAKAKGQPWEAAKAFDASAPISPIRPSASGWPSGRIRLWVNGEVRQDGDLKAMIWSPAEIIAALSKLWRLEAGDLIFTGTPEGVGPIVRGDEVEGEIDGVGRLTLRLV